VFVINSVFGSERGVKSPFKVFACGRRTEVVRGSLFPILILNQPQRLLGCHQRDSNDTEN